MLFFFKLKTAYGVLISDWSSDVCSSDHRIALLVTRHGDLGHEQTVALRAIDQFGPYVHSRKKQTARIRELSADDLAASCGIDGDVSELEHALFRISAAVLQLELHLRRATTARYVTGKQLLAQAQHRSEEHTSELQSLMRLSYAVFCLNKKKTKKQR